MEKGHSDMEMQTFDQHLLELYQANKIKLETARDAASNPRDFATKLALEGDSAYTDNSGSLPGSSDESRF